MSDAYSVFIWSVRYWIVFAQAGVKWFDTQFVGWLNGHFANVTASTLSGGDDTCDNIWCFLGDLLANAIEDIIRPVLDAFLGWINLILYCLLGIITLLLGLAFSLLGIGVSSVLFCLQLLAALFLAYHEATPTPIPGIPDCTIATPNENFWCAALWVLENTVWGRTSHIFTSVSAGEVITNIVVGIGTINLVVWVIGKTRNIFLEASKAV
jgi:hypothetical protein